MIKSVEWKTDLRLLPQDDIAKIHDASLHILSKTGMRMPLSDKRLDALSDFGLKVDRRTRVVRFPPDIVENAIRKAPQSYTLHARNPQYNLMLDGRHGYLCLDGAGLRVRDIGTHVTRNSTYADLTDVRHG